MKKELVESRKQEFQPRKKAKGRASAAASSRSREESVPIRAGDQRAMG